MKKKTLTFELNEHELWLLRTGLELLEEQAAKHRDAEKQRRLNRERLAEAAVDVASKRQHQRAMAAHTLAAEQIDEEVVLMQDLVAACRQLEEN